uniref:Pectinesterase inhibitor domain-containing protein n=1 Tax=Triticum urartu TaxID=4572 RepID=A0A8R7TN04_TRIUA
MGPSRALPCLVLLFLLSSSSAFGVEDTCKSIAAGKEMSIDYNYRIKFFEASKGSATADKHGLAVITSKLNRAAAKSLGKRIHALRALEKDKVIQMDLDICSQLYSKAVDELDA